MICIFNPELKKKFQHLKCSPVLEKNISHLHMKSMSYLYILLCLRVHTTARGLLPRTGLLWPYVRTHVIAWQMYVWTHAIPVYTDHGTHVYLLSQHARNCSRKVQLAHAHAITAHAHAIMAHTCICRRGTRAFTVHAHAITAPMCNHSTHAHAITAHSHTHNMHACNRSTRT